jgi:thioredoxin-like negative regulator of GroEL
VLSSHENNHLAAENGVMGAPTLIFYCEGRPVGTAVGFQPKDRLKQLVDDMLEKHKKCVSQSTKLKTD